MKHLSPKEFYSQVSKWVSGKRLYVAEKWCNAVVEVIIQECFFKHACKVPLLGTFDLVHHEESTQKQIINGEAQTVIVPERFSVKFTPCDSFINDVNGEGVTKMYRKRVKENKLTKRDIERQLRFEKEKVDEYFKQQEKLKEELRQEAQKENKNKKAKKDKALKDFEKMLKERVRANGQED